MLDKTLIKVRKTKSITTARKSIVKLVKLQSPVGKYCEIRKIKPREACEFCIYLYYARKNLLTHNQAGFVASNARTFLCINFVFRSIPRSHVLPNVNGEDGTAAVVH